MREHSCYYDPEGCTAVCDARSLADYERSPEGRRRAAAVARVEGRHLVKVGELRGPDLKARLSEYDVEEHG